MLGRDAIKRAAGDVDGPRAEEIRAMVEEVLDAQLRDIEIAGFDLSGGLDSSAMVAIAASRAQRMHTFTIALPDDVDNDETAWAREVRRFAGVEGSERDPLHMSLDEYGGLARSTYDFPGYPNTMLRRTIHRAARAR